MPTLKRVFILSTALVAAILLAVAEAAFCGPADYGVPGVVIDYSPASTNAYIGCPAIEVMPDGSYVASHSFFGPGTTNDTSVVFASSDGGSTWEKLATIKGQWWSSLFYHNGALYIMGVDKEYGHAVIRRSDVGGRTWTSPVDGKSGLLLGEGEYHCAPVPVVVHNDRIWRAYEERNPPKDWGVNFLSFVMSAPADADLLDAANWTATNRLRYDQNWPGSAWLEGNVVVTRSGMVKNILRNHTETGGKAAVIDISLDGTKASFNPENGFIDFPGGSKKFTIRYDPVSRMYWTLSNWIPEKHSGGNPERTRNTLALVSSLDLRQWNVRSIILYNPDVEKTGYQYVDWRIEGDSMIFVSRTAFDDGAGGAHNCHDANFFTFHRIPNFWKRTMDDPPLE